MCAGFEVAKHGFLACALQVYQILPQNEIYCVPGMFVEQQGDRPSNISNISQNNRILRNL